MQMGIIYAPTVLGVAISLCVLDIIAVALRFMNRKRLRQTFQVDDWLILTSLALFFGLVAVMVYGVHTRALGYTSPLMELQNLQPRSSGRSSIESMVSLLSLTAKLEYSFLVIAAAALGLVKVSVLVFYRRIFVVDKHNILDLRNIIMNSMIVLTGLWAASFCLALMWMCKGDFQAAFQPPAIAATKCVDTPLLGFALSISDFNSDVLIILLPMPFIWKLKLTLGKKFAVTAVFMLGILASVASLIRMIFMIWSKNIGFDPSLDGELITTASLFWFVVEVAVGILAACLPTLRGLFKNGKLDSMLRDMRTRLSLSRSSTHSKRGSTQMNGKARVPNEIVQRWQSTEVGGIKRVDSLEDERTFRIEA